MKPNIGISGLLIIDYKVLLGRRQMNDTLPGILVSPGGGIKWQEQLDIALKREFKEETNIDVIVDQWSSIQERIHNDKHTIMIFKKVFCNDASQLKLMPEFSEVIWLELSDIELHKSEISEMTYLALKEL